jgi:hypothetical protein
LQQADQTGAGKIGDLLVRHVAVAVGRFGLGGGVLADAVRGFDQRVDGVGGRSRRLPPRCLSAPFEQIAR